MKTATLRIVSPIALFVLLALAGRADTSAHAQIIKERDTVLSKILAYHESSRATGMADDDAVYSARLALLSFRRDAAAAVTEKLKQQELILKVRQSILNLVETKVRAGVARDVDRLLAEEGVLQAKQLLEELRLDEKTG